MSTFALRTGCLAAPFIVAIACDSTVSAVMAPDAASGGDAGVSTSDAASAADVEADSVADAAPDVTGLQACPFGSEARSLIAEAIVRGFVDAKHVSRESHPPEPPFNGRVAHGFSLVGTNNTLLESFSPIQPCNAANAQWYVAYCDPKEAYAPGEFGEKFGRCSRSGCEVSGNFLVESYFTLRPQTASTPRHTISYPFEAIEGSPLVGRTGTVTWAENPFQLWTRVLGGSGSLVVTADSSRAISVALDAGPTVDLTATTHTEVRKTASEETERLLFEISFSKLTTAGTVVASVETTDPTEATVAGTVKLASEVLATATAASDQMPALTWQGVCK